MTDLTLEIFRNELQTALDAGFASIRVEIESIRVRVDGLPLIGNAIDILQRDMRLLKSAINDMARVNITAGEVQALHDDLQRAFEQIAELQTKFITLERKYTTPL